jgi:membrane associated rhomboid family serine protease
VVTWGLVAACALVFGVQWLVGPSLIDRYALVPHLLVSRGESPARLLGSMFLHGDLLHLLGNLYVLKVFGDNVEDRLGRGWYLGFYLASGLGAAGLYVALSASSTVPAIGASGAIAGALGAYVVFFPRARVRLVPVLSVAASVIVGALFFSGPYPALSAVVVIAVLLCALPALALYSRGSDLTLLRPIQLRAMYYLPLWFLWQVVSAARGTGGVAWWAHVGGFVTGAALALGVGRRLADPRVGVTGT